MPMVKNSKTITSSSRQKPQASRAIPYPFNNALYDPHTYKPMVTCVLSRRQQQPPQTFRPPRWPLPLTPNKQLWSSWIASLHSTLW